MLPYMSRSRSIVLLLAVGGLVACVLLSTHQRLSDAAAAEGQHTNHWERAAAAVQGRAYVYTDTDYILSCWVNGFESNVKGAMDVEMDLWVRTQSFLERLGDGNCDNMRLMFADPGVGRLVDVGCGMGRIVLRYGPMFQAVDCIEPDDNRRHQAIAELNKSHERWWSQGRVSFHSTRFLDFDDRGGVDALTIIHVVQHIPTYELNAWLKKIQEMLTPGGIMVLATTMSNKGHTYYATDDGKQVKEDEFNYFADTSRKDSGGAWAKHGGRLSVRFFLADDIKKYIKEAGMQVLEHGKFMFHKGFKFKRSESQYIVATRDQDVHLWINCLPTQYLQPPRYANFHMVGLEKQLKAKHNWEKYCKKGSDLAKDGDATTL